VHKRKHYLLNKVSLTKEFSTEISVDARGGELGRQHNDVVITVIIPIGRNPNLIEILSYRKARCQRCGRIPLLPYYLYISPFPP